MSASSPVAPNPSTKLNPNASSFVPNPLIQSGLVAQSHGLEIYLPHQFPQAPQVAETPQFMYYGFNTPCPELYGYYPTLSGWNSCIDLYNSSKQPYPEVSVINDGENYGSKEMDGKKKKSARYGNIPPRLMNMRRNYPVLRPLPLWFPREAGDVKIEALIEESMKIVGNTSLMIKNIPNHLRRAELLKMLNIHCRFENRNAKPESTISAYDFFYLPMDFGFRLNLGYAFVNFTSPEAASRFFKVFHKRKWGCAGADGKIKSLEIRLAKLQGRDALLQNFQFSSFCCHTNQFLPVMFSPPRTGFNNPKPITVGRYSHESVSSKVMIMTQRKEKKA